MRAVVPWILCTLLWLRCGEQATQAGNGTGHEGETRTVAISGTLLGAKGTPAVRVPVSLLSRHYLSLSPQSMGQYTTTTDTEGAYRFSEIPAGAYTVQARDTSRRTLSIPVDVSVSSQTVSLAQEQLQLPGALSGVVYMDNPAATVQVRVYGVDMQPISVASGQPFVLSDIPAGSWTVLVAGNGGYLATTREIATHPGDTAILEPITLEPYGCRDFTCDSLVLRAILDTNGLHDVAVDTSVVVKSSSGRARQVFLSRISLLPDTITMLRAMEELFVTNAGAFDTLPSVIGRLTNVHKLFVYKTGLRFIAPEIGRMYKLRDLVLINGELETLPMELMQCNRLGNNRFWLGNNHLVDLPEDLQSWIDSRTDQPDWRDSQTPPE